MRIALDAMGGDHAPMEIVKGAVEVAPQLEGEILLVGEANAISHVQTGPLPSNVRIVEASQVVEMHESPVEALRKKKDSSLVVAANLVKTGEADAFISAGNTGACAAAAHMFWKCLPNINRPAIVTIFPSRKGQFVLLDSGATVDADVRNMVEFALMGGAYSEAVMGVKTPKIGLLNIGEEETKGNALAKASHKAMAASIPNFVGNVEGKEIFNGDVDVVVCDAFVGNVLLKAAEGMGEFLVDLVRAALPKNSLMRNFTKWLMRDGLRELQRKTDYAEYGGAPLLGVNGLCIICHGRSSAKAIRNAVLAAQREHRSHMNDLISHRALALTKELDHVG